MTTRRDLPPKPSVTASAERARSLLSQEHPSIEADGDDDGERTELDPTRFGPPSADPSEEGEVTEFKRSLNAPLKTDMLYRRIVATAQDAFDFHAQFERRRPRTDGREDAVEAMYGKLRVVAEVRALEKMHGWVSARSAGFTLEVQGRFLARRRPDHILVDDFLPLPSFCQSLAYETQSPTDRHARFGNAKMRTISPDDWKPHEMRVYEELGVFSASHAIAFDPLKVQIPFHSHYTRSLYQRGPSPGDTDHLHHLKWLFTPVTGLNILYSGTIPFQAELPHTFPGVPVPVDLGAHAEGAHNPADCRVVVRRDDGALSATIPLDTGLVIGRDRDCEMPVPEQSLSRRHARLWFADDGVLMLEDLGSKNGTFLEGKRVTKPVAVRRPTKLRIGEIDVEVRF